MPERPKVGSEAGQVFCLVFRQPEDNAVPSFHEHFAMQVQSSVGVLSLRPSAAKSHNGKDDLVVITGLLDDSKKIGVGFIDLYALKVLGYFPEILLQFFFRPGSDRFGFIDRDQNARPIPTHGQFQLGDEVG
jgi:hypothetical protein